MSIDKDGFWESPKKQKLRLMVAKAFGKARPRVSIFLPGNDIACLKLIWDQDYTDSEMKIIVVERRSDVMGAIQEKIRALSPVLFSQCRFHQGELHELAFADKVQFAFIDLLGNITKELYDWFVNSYLPATSNKCITYLTLQKAYRGNHFMRAWRNYVWNVSPELKTIFFQYREDQKLRNPGIAKTFYNRKVPYTLWLLDGMFLQAGKRHRFKNIVQYRDGKMGKSMASTMLFIKIKQYRGKPVIEIPDMKSINLDYMMSCLERKMRMSTTDAKRKLAGQRAAYTRAFRKGDLVKAESYKIPIKRLENFLAKSLK